MSFNPPTTTLDPVRAEERRGKVRAGLPTDVDGVLITRLVNVRYLTGFTGSNAALLLTRTRAVFCTDGRYVTQSKQQVPDVDLLVDKACAAALVSRAQSDGLGRLAFEAHDVTVEDHAALQSLAPTLELMPLGHVVERLRQTKDETEIELLQQACAIGDRAFADLIESLKPGRTELAIARELEGLMYAYGAEAVAFSTIVGSGPNSAIPHHSPTDRAVRPGEFLKIDFGARYAGYHADMTRTVVVGGPPEAWQEDLYTLVEAAQRAGCEALKPGVDVSQVDAASRSVIADAGFGDQFPHGLGHGVGLEIHEAPLIGYSSTGILGERTSVTVEPGVYLPGRGGVRIEDTLVVRDGGPQLLTNTTKELLVL